MIKKITLMHMIFTFLKQKYWKTLNFTLEILNPTKFLNIKPTYSIKRHLFANQADAESKMLIVSKVSMAPLVLMAVQDDSSPPITLPA